MFHSPEYDLAHIKKPITKLTGPLKLHLYINCSKRNLCCESDITIGIHKTFKLFKYPTFNSGNVLKS